MKKEDFLGLGVWLLILAGLAIYLFLPVRDHFTSSSFGGSWFIYILFIFGAILTGVVFNAILFELAHIIGAKIGGYRVTSTNILGFCFYKKDNKTKFRFSSFDGLTGETKITPKENNKREANPSAYLLNGCLFYALEITAIITAFSFMDSVNDTLVVDWAYFILTVGVIGGGMLLYNIVPLKLDNATDGYKLRLLGGRKNVKNFNALLTASEKGTALKVEESTKEEKEKVNNPFSSDMKLNNAYVLLKDQKFDEALAVFEEILKTKKANKNVRFAAEINIIYVNIVTKNFEEASEYVSSNVSLAMRKSIADDATLQSIRTYILLAGLFDKSKSECLYALNQLNHAYKKVPEGRKELEEELINNSIKMVLEKHPSWEELKAFLK